MCNSVECLTVDCYDRIDILITWSGMPVSIRKDGGSKLTLKLVTFIEYESARYNCKLNKNIRHHNRENPGT